MEFIPPTGNIYQNNIIQQAKTQEQNLINRSFESFTPRFLLRYAPGHMRKTESGRLNYSNIFNLNKIHIFLACHSLILSMFLLVKVR